MRFHDRIDSKILHDLSILYYHDLQCKGEAVICVKLFWQFIRYFSQLSTGRVMQLRLTAGMSLSPKRMLGFMDWDSWFLGYRICEGLRCCVVSTASHALRLITNYREDILNSDVSSSK